eukprot:TRINITY_DN30191_c0_g1_i1.p1 TRINITY_DN30191_c0_g1~~TRINITY_DN30191_c0_g1_i1.p1  ORF type:complete len:915 (+),score=146.89 TRINITY_DN30191_c0_g1_i1:97-2841(+)
MLVAAAAAAAAGWLCLDEGVLSRRDVCWDVHGRRAYCDRITEELWTAAWQDRPLWADFGYYDANGDFQTLVRSGDAGVTRRVGHGLSVEYRHSRGVAQLFRPHLEFGGVCGDGNLHTASSARYAPLEACDDGNTLNGDGCSARCQVESGFTCVTVAVSPYQASVCRTVADTEGELRATAAVVDEALCSERDAAAGTSGPSRAASGQQAEDAGNETVCGDVFQALSAEECDDGNVEDDDGCSAECTVEAGYSCYPSTVNGTVYGADAASGVSECVRNVCGDGFLHPTEQCDDGNDADGDGCDVECEIEPNHDCVPQGGGSTCFPPVCGDGRTATTEPCDDGNVAPDDGCSAVCTLETNVPYTCFVDEKCDAPPCEMFVEQGPTICVPTVAATPTPIVPTAVPETVAPTAPPTPAPTTSVPKGPSAADAKMMYSAERMTGFLLDRGPCGVVLNGQEGCCQHLTELDHYGYATGLRDLTQCRWPHTGYVFVANATCEANGYYSIRSEEECATAAISLRLDDTSPFYMTDENMTGVTLATLNLTFPALYAGVERNFSGVYDRINPRLYRIRNGTGVPDTAYIAFTESTWKLSYGTYKGELLAGAWGYASETLLGNWSAYDKDWALTFQEKRRQVGTQLITELIGFVDSNPKDWGSDIYPIVTPVGGLPNGCLARPHTNEIGRLVLQDAVEELSIAARCTSEDRCLCRTDPWNVSYANYSASVGTQCSYLLHQLHCAYPCTARYLNHTEAPCVTDAECGRGSICNVPQDRKDRVVALERKLAERRDNDDLFCFRCDSVGEIEAELAGARAALVGSCTATGLRAPPCRSWLQTVYDACREQPVAYIPWAPEIKPPAPHCQPLWWRHRTFESFYESYVDDHLGVAFNDTDNSDHCWSASAHTGVGVWAVVGAAVVWASMLL